MKAYWFSREDGTTQHQKEPAEIGRTDTVDGKIIPCAKGLHASPTPWDALHYARGPVLWEVEIDDDAIPHLGDKFASRARKYIRRADLTKAMRSFAAQQALRVAHLWEMPPIVSEYLDATAKGVDREDIRDAALAATRAAAWDAALAATRAAALDAAMAAAKEQFNEMAFHTLSAR